MKDILNRPDAKDILDHSGKILHHGPHIHHRPVWYKKHRDGRVEEIEADMTQPMVGAATSISPPLPSDIGKTLDVSKNELWSPWAGTTLPDSDTYQGQYGSCYYISEIDSVDGENPGYIRSPDVIRKNADGTFSVTFRRNGPFTVNVSGLVSSTGCRVNPKTGACALLIFEKAYAYYRYGKNTYASIDSGWPGSVMTDLGMTNIAVNTKTGLTALLAAIAGNASLAACTNGTTKTLISAHCYRLISIFVSGGVTYVTLRNPWGFDGSAITDNPNDGIVTITLAQFQADVSVVAVSTGYASDVRLATAEMINPLAIPVNKTATWNADKYSAISNCKVKTLTKDQVPPDGIIEAGSIQGNAYIEYILNVIAAGSYTLTAKVACPGMSQIDVSLNGNSVAKIGVPNTKSWTAFQAVSTNIILPVGLVKLRFSNVNNAIYNIGNFSLQA